MKEKVNVLYFGCETNTVLLIAQDDDFVLKGLARDSTLIKLKTRNPVDALFRMAYRGHEKKQNPAFISFCNTLFQALSFLASPIYRKSKDLLNLLVRQGIPLVNTRRQATLEQFVASQDIHLFVVNFWYILPKRVLQLPPMGCVNIHPSKLPRYKGALPTLWALKHKDTSSAVTYMTLDETVDGGKIIAQHEFEISTTDNALDIEQKVNTIISETFITDLKAYIHSTLPLMEQQGEASFTERFERYRQVRFKEEEAVDIYNKILLYHHLSPATNCFVLHSSQKIRLTGCREVLRNQKLTPGSYAIKGKKLFVGCKDDTLVFKAGADVRYLDFLRLFAKQLLNKGFFPENSSELLATQQLK